MLTTPYIDFLVDPNLFRVPKHPETRSRDVRAAYIFSLVLGGLLGGGIYRAGGSTANLWFSAALKAVTIAWVATVGASRRTAGASDSCAV